MTASLLRTVLAEAAERIGLVVAEVDLRVTELLDTDPAVPPEAPEPEPAAGQRLPGDSEAGRVAAAVLAVPGVSRLTGTPAGPVRLYASGQPGGTALPHRHARVDLAVRADHHPLEVAGAVRTAVTNALPDHPTATVLVTALD